MSPRRSREIAVLGLEGAALASSGRFKLEPQMDATIAELSL